MLQFHHPGRVFQERPLTSGYLTETRWVDISHSWDKWIWQLTWTKVLLSEGCWSEVILTHWMLRKLRGSGASHYYINEQEAKRQVQMTVKEKNWGLNNQLFSLLTFSPLGPWKFNPIFPWRERFEFKTSLTMAETNTTL